MPSVYALPQEIDNPDAVAKQVAEVLGQPLATVQHQLTSTAPFVWLARQLPPEVGERLQKLNLRGVQVLQETRRFYPKRHLAGQVLGFVGVDGLGLGGLEHLYNRELTGTPRQVRLQRDASGRTVQIVDGDPSDQPRGADLYVTLDERLQYVAEKEIAARVHEIGGAVELAEVPWSLGPDPVAAGHEIAVGHCVRGLFKFPQIFGKSRDCRGRIKNNFRAVKAQATGSIRKMSVVANINTDFSVLSVKNGIA